VEPRLPVSVLAIERLKDLLRLELDLDNDHDRLRLLISAANWGVARLLKREVRHRGDLEWALWRIPVPRAPGTLPTRGRMLWIPGWGDSPMSWLGILAGAFDGSGFEEIVALDFPGFHGSHAHRRCIGDMDRVLEIACEAVGELHPEVVGGHSLGGWLASWSVLKAGQRAPGRVLLISPSGITGGVQERELWHDEFREWTESSPEEYISRVFGSRPPVIAPLVRRFAPFMQRQDSQEFLNSVQDRHYLEPLLPQMKPHVHVELLWGTEDGVVPERFATHWIRLLPSTRFTRWEGVGHMPHLESPLRLIRWMREIVVQGS